MLKDTTADKLILLIAALSLKTPTKLRQKFNQITFICGDKDGDWKCYKTGDKYCIVI